MPRMYDMNDITEKCKELADFTPQIKYRFPCFEYRYCSLSDQELADVLNDRFQAKIEVDMIIGMFDDYERNWKPLTYISKKPFKKAKIVELEQGRR